EIPVELCGADRIAAAVEVEHVSVRARVARDDANRRHTIGINAGRLRPARRMRNEALHALEPQANVGHRYRRRPLPPLQIGKAQAQQLSTPAHGRIFRSRAVTTRLRGMRAMLVYYQVGAPGPSGRLCCITDTVQVISTHDTIAAPGTTPGWAYFRD